MATTTAGDPEDIGRLLRVLEEPEMIALWGVAVAASRRVDAALERALAERWDAETIGGLIAQHRGWYLVRDAALVEAQRRGLTF